MLINIGRVFADRADNFYAAGLLTILNLVIMDTLQDLSGTACSKNSVQPIDWEIQNIIHREVDLCGRIC